ncbi:response regulator transcription factor [Arthrobacter antibioticus]|uniref:response regulator transcription factor n=1 Tax=Arthrobacter sp. H35-MC1 TaxID=3046203 RepID=UPI0024B89C6C|nr:response regulator [Arthrobacter sp. H35-MC1]MDJ0317129.1 response regulator [Arthrobacter sp. H35-MC1]
MLDFRGKKALVIEDDDDIRGLLEIVLSQMGFSVTSLATGRAGLESARSARPDLITLDIGLPDINGVAVLRELRIFHDGKVVMLSARGRQGDIDSAMAAGADAYILKPFRAISLKEELAEIIRR